MAVLPPRIVEHALAIQLIGEMCPTGWAVSMTDTGDIAIVAPERTDIVGYVERDRTPRGWRARIAPHASSWVYRDGSPSAVSHVVATIQRAIEGRS